MDIHLALIFFAYISSYDSGVHRRKVLSLALTCAGALALSSCNVLESPKPLPLDEGTTRRLAQLAQAHPKVQAAAVALSKQGYEVDWARTAGTKLYLGLDKLVALGVFTNDPNRYFILAFRDDSLGIAGLSAEWNPLVMAGLIQIINPSPENYDFVFTDLLAGKAASLSMNLRTEKVSTFESADILADDMRYGSSSPRQTVTPATECRVPESLLRSLDSARLNEAAAYGAVALAASGVTSAKAALGACLTPAVPACAAAVSALAVALGWLAQTTAAAVAAQKAREAAELAIEEWRRQNCR